MGEGVLHFTTLTLVVPAIIPRFVRTRALRVASFPHRRDDGVSREASFLPLNVSFKFSHAATLEVVAILEGSQTEIQSV